MTAKLTDRERWRRELSSAAPLDIATDALADVVFSLILEHEAELLAAAEAEADAGFPGQKESELAVRALLRLILSPNVRMPFSRLQRHGMATRPHRRNKTMTTKPKTRKAAVAKRAASKSAMVKTDGESKSVISGICKLIARWRWLEADRAYNYAITNPEKKTDRLVMSHQKEQRDIEVRLSKLVPKNLWQVMHLLELRLKWFSKAAPMIWKSRC
jgi:hypothetical protein